MNFAALPILRMLPTPAHDGVRLLLPAFAFLAILAGWGIASAGEAAARLAACLFGARRRGTMPEPQHRSKDAASLPLPPRGGGPGRGGLARSPDAERRQGSRIPPSPSQRTGSDSERPRKPRRAPFRSPPPEGGGTTTEAEAAPRGRILIRAILAATFLLPAARQLIRIHPYELSYYNELIGGPREPGAAAWS